MCRRPIGDGYGEHIKGRKRHIAVDTLGWSVVIITAAPIQDSAGGKIVLDRLLAAHPTVATTRENTQTWRDLIPGNWQTTR